MAIASSCILVAISIIGAGICFYKKYGYSHYGSGHIRILSEDGSIEEEVLFTMYHYSINFCYPIVVKWH